MSASPATFATVSPAQRRTPIAAALGWMLDSFDVMLYALVVTHLMRDLGMTKSTAGLLPTLTNVASGIGGVLFGFLADRVGRTRALSLSILTYAACSFASGLATSILMLAVFRFILGLGMGGEWTTGAALVAETWPAHLRAKALAIVQSSWAIGYALAAVVAWAVLQRWDWRAVFFVGVLPALFTLWIQKDVPESDLWRERHGRHLAMDSRAHVSFSELFTGRWARRAFILTLTNFFGMFAWWGLFIWVPAFLSLPVDQGGRDFPASETTWMLVFLNLTGMLPGYASFGWVADWLGRKRAFILYLLVAAALIPVYATVRSPLALLLLGSPVAFFGTGFFSGSGIIGSELFPTSIRARALGITYNGARMLGAIAPFIIGWVGQHKGLGSAFYLCGASFFLAALAATGLPETRGLELE